MRMIGERLRIARSAAGLSLRDLADKIDNRVTAQAIGKYERNEMTPVSSVLMLLARALAVSEEYLLSDGRVQLEGIDFRRTVANPRAEAALQATLLREIEKYLELEDLLSESTREWVLPQGFPYRVSELASAEVAAARLRAAWELGSDPIPNLAEFLEDRGLKVFALGLDDDLSGVMAWVRRPEGPPVPVIVVNAAHDGERQRFTLAHELAHLMLDVLEGLDEERACDRFAGAFLIPGDVLAAKVGKHRQRLVLGELFELKALFGVSAQAIVYRCKDAGIIDQQAYREVFKSIVVRGWRKKEPFNLQSETPKRFLRLCYRALAEGLLSRPKAAELLGISNRELEDLLQADTKYGEDTVN
jgi:Zn-dependent peptidase ImmA (M78 family)/transcriptional regulator with XRE-family HTH domain